MSPMQQIFLGMGAVAKKTYVDDVFSTYLWTGNETANRDINNGIDLSGEGGLVWVKQRNAAVDNYLADTIRGDGELLKSNSSEGQAGLGNRITGFNTNGFELGNHTKVNGASSNTYSSWSFRKAPGFFDVVTWTGNGVAGRQISHSLSSIPGCIMIKCTSNDASWTVGHRSLNSGIDPWDYLLMLHNSDAEANDATQFNDTAPTSTHFTVGAANTVNGSGKTYVAYVFAGGESGAATARSVDFDGNDYLSFANTSDFVFGTGAYTVEFWIKPDSTPNGNMIFSANGSNGFVINMDSDSVNINKFGVGDVVSSTSMAPVGQWTHYAFVREGTGSNQTKIYVNGQLDKIGTDSNDWTVNSNWGLGARNSDAAFGVDGKLSNFRIVKGTAVYTSSFRPPTEPLTSITNTKLLCCNNSSTTGSTVTPGTITANGDPTASTDSPFDDPDGFVLGDAGDQNVIKTGSYIGNGTTGLEVNVGFEPQWVLVKNASASQYWMLADSMRGIATGVNDALLYPNASDSEDSTDRFSLTPTGFKVTSDADVNGSGNTMVYVAIRRPDGYVGKPPELGTGVFNMDTAASSYPKYSAGFAPDWVFSRRPATAEAWKTMARLIGPKKGFLNTNAAWATDNGNVWDNNTHWRGGPGDDPNTYQAWMWKRHAGFDVVTYDGTGAAAEFAHSLNQTPEMVIIKPRDQNIAWAVFHSGLSANTKQLELDSTAGESNSGFTWSPTSTHFNVGTAWEHNRADYPYLALLFSSVSGISKVGSYTGDGTSNGSHEITCGFTPRFLIIKCVTSGVNFSHWRLWDSLNGLDGSGNESYLKVNDTGAKVDGYDYIDTTSTGFKFNTAFGPVNGNGNKMVYYAHA